MFVLILIKFHVEQLIYLPRKTNNTEISLGETPDILDACEMVTGLILDNFCFASIDIDLI